jgi:hypothetical protein
MADILSDSGSGNEPKGTVYGIAGFAFALRHDGIPVEELKKIDKDIERRRGEPNPCNRRLATELYIAHEWLREGMDARDSIVVGVQWEINLALPGIYVPDDLVVTEHRQKGQYLDSAEVADQITEGFNRRDVTDIIVIANPFIHLAYCKRLMKKRGYNVIDYRLNPIGFDPRSDQSWTRNKAALLRYIVRSKLFGTQGDTPKASNEGEPYGSAIDRELDNFESAVNGAKK